MSLLNSAISAAVKNSSDIAKKAVSKSISSSSNRKNTSNVNTPSVQSNPSGIYQVANVAAKPGYTSREGVTYAPSADLSRQQGLSGGVAQSGGYTNFYDDLGYAYKSIKGASDYTPTKDANAVNGTYSTNGAATDIAMLTAADRQKIADIRAQLTAGAITGDQANAAANAIRSGYGYTIDKSGAVTDLGALQRVNDNREKWGLSVNAPNSYQQNYQELWGGAAGGGSSAGRNGSDAEEYLRELYAQQTAAELANLKATYEQNAADIKAQNETIANLYQQQKNQAAAQNELARMQMNEYAAMQGLNTGAAGQMALSQSAAYQGNIGALGSQEAQSLSDNALNLQKLTAAYRNAADQASANGNAQLASALYDEYVRQQNLAIQAQQAAQEQANWEAQFQYGQQTDSRDYANAMVSYMLQNGVMPDANTLAAAGFGTSQAQSISDIYRQQLALDAAYQQSKLSAKKKSDVSDGSPARDVKDLGTFDTGDFTNPHSDSMVRVDSGGSSSYMTWSAAQRYVQNGAYKIAKNSDGTYTLKKA